MWQFLPPYSPHTQATKFWRTFCAAWLTVYIVSTFWNEVLTLTKLRDKRQTTTTHGPAVIYWRKQRKIAQIASELRDHEQQQWNSSNKNNIKSEGSAHMSSNRSTFSSQRQRYRTSRKHETRAPKARATDRSLQMTQTRTQRPKHALTQRDLTAWYEAISVEAMHGARQLANRA